MYMRSSGETTVMVLTVRHDLDFWAISIHTVTAFLYCGLGGRPFWNTALLAHVPGQCVCMVALISIIFEVVKGIGSPLDERPARFDQRPSHRTDQPAYGDIEVFTEFYTGGSHRLSPLPVFGLHGYHGLVPWIWTSIAFNVIAAILFLTLPFSAIELFV